MVQVDPKLLMEKTPRSNGMVRNSMTSMLALMKSAFTSALQTASLKVEMKNEARLQADLKRVIQLLEKAKDLEIGKASVSTETITGFRVNNLEKLNLENVESLAFAFEQLDPIVKSLRSSDQSNKQTLILFNKLLNQVTQLKLEAARKTIKFPVVQQVKGDVTVTNFPDTQAQIVAALGRVEGALKSALVKKEVKKEAKIELAEGKAILEKLSEVTESLQRLPGNMEFPTEVQVTNFPPQKIPQPVTNISINALAGTTKSRAITVGTTPTPLPDEVLAYRRSLVVYNNSAQTIYIGGSDVTTTNGMPVPASSYSPAFDAGDKMVVYGIVASSTANVRTLEASDIRVGR